MKSNLWWQFNDQYQLSYVNWAAYTDYSANANAFWNGTQYDQLNNASLWAPSGILVNNKYQSTNQGVTC
uniref:Uncharacterized protein n=1 Tax=Acrobeloides nanus TaxID=290746 RepID=A0A914DCS6_9BILA